MESCRVGVSYAPPSTWWSHAGCRLGGGMERAVGGMAGFRGAAAGCDRLGLGTDV